MPPGYRGVAGFPPPDNAPWKSAILWPGIATWASRISSKPPGNPSIMAAMEALQGSKHAVGQAAL